MEEIDYLDFTTLVSLKVKRNAKNLTPIQSTYVKEGTKGTLLNAGRKVFRGYQNVLKYAL